MVLNLANFQNSVDAVTTRCSNASDIIGSMFTIFADLIHKNGHGDEKIITKGSGLSELPGFYEQTTEWDFMVMRCSRLTAVIRLNIVPNPTEDNEHHRIAEAVYAAHALQAAYRCGMFGEQAPRPFVGWLMLVEDAPSSRLSTSDRSDHFPVRPEFQGASYLERYNLLCRKLVQENLYTSAAVLASPRTAIATGKFSDVSELTSLKMFVTNFAAHIAAEASRGE